MSQRIVGSDLETEFQLEIPISQFYWILWICIQSYIVISARLG